MKARERFRKIIRKKKKSVKQKQKGQRKRVTTNNKISFAGKYEGNYYTRIPSRYIYKFPTRM